MWSVMQRPLTGVGVLVAQVLRAAHRDDIPSLQNQDPSGTFGDPSLPKLRIAVLGDSSVTAPGVIPPNAAWPQRLGHYLSDRMHVEIESVAVGGSKARDVLRSQLEPVAQFCPDLVALSVGANDALRGTSIGQFEAEYDLILAKLTSLTPLVVAGGVGDLGTLIRLPTLARAIARVRGRSINNAILRVASRYPTVCKTQTWGSAWERFETMPEQYFAPDQFHASAEGHGLFAASIYPAVDALLASPHGRALIASRESPESAT